MNTTITRTLDLGDLGLHEAKITVVTEKITGISGEYSCVKSIEVECKGSTVELVNLLPRDLEAEIIDKVELDALIAAHDEKLNKELRSE